VCGKHLFSFLKQSLVSWALVSDPHWIRISEFLDPDPQFDPDPKFFVTIFMLKHKFFERIRPWIWIRIYFKPWIQIRMKWMRIQNPAFYQCIQINTVPVPGNSEVMNPSMSRRNKLQLVAVLAQGLGSNC